MVENIPKGQFTRVQRNCTHDNDYLEQAHVLKCHFIEKGYNTDNLERTIQEIHIVPQSNCLTDRPKHNTNNHQWGFISGYHAQYKDVEAIFKKYWSLLTTDTILTRAIPDEPVW